jgi:hypothetical protein
MVKARKWLMVVVVQAGHPPRRRSCPGIFAWRLDEIFPRAGVSGRREIVFRHGRQNGKMPASAACGANHIQAAKVAT